MPRSLIRFRLGPAGRAILLGLLAIAAGLAVAYAAVERVRFWFVWREGYLIGAATLGLWIGVRAAFSLGGWQRAAGIAVALAYGYVLAPVALEKAQFFRENGYWFRSAEPVGAAE